jgi:hypothetical protein
MTTAEQKIISSRHIPEGYSFKYGVTQDPTEGYCKDVETPSGTRFIALIFIGRAINPTFHVQFSSDERRNEYVNSKIATYLERKKQKKERIKERSLMSHTLEVGSILVSSWGYDQTNIDYYQVTKLIGKTMVEIRSIGATVVATHGTYQDVAPVKDSFFTPRYEGDTWKIKPMRKKVDPVSNSVSINSFASAYPWNGKSDTETHPMFGR